MCYDGIFVWEYVMKKFLLSALMGAVAIGVASPAMAEQRYNQVSFEVSVEQMVANDELRATLTKSAESATAKGLANTLNTATNKALSLAKKYPSIKVSTGYGHTYPRYDNKGKIKGFAGSASINVESQDFEQASDFIAEVQTFMTLNNLDFGVSAQTQKQVESTLKQELIKKFNDEAKLTSQAFGATSYKLVQVDLNGGGRYTVSPMMGMAVAEATTDAKAVAQDFQGGDSRISHHARGSIELVY